MAKKAANQNGETTAGYFRQVFKENPTLLKSKSNAELLDRWLTDHPGNREVPKNVKANLQNVKSILRSKGRKRQAKKEAQAEDGVPGAQLAKRPAPRKTDLERFEEQIDDVLTFARTLDPEGLGSVINHLRVARREVVWKMGQ